MRSVIHGWLVELVGRALREEPDLEGLSASLEDTHPMHRRGAAGRR
jgi:6-phosphogluconate dehydrogenase (decarboxylating)